MEPLIRKMKKFLRKEFPGAEIELEASRASGKVGGMLVWRGFQDMDQLERQHQLWEAIRNNLSPDDQAKVTAILTMTPWETLALKEPAV